MYFDEGAATDFIYIFEGGKAEEHKEKIISKTNNLEIRTEATVKGTTKFLKLKEVLKVVLHLIEKEQLLLKGL